MPATTLIDGPFFEDLIYPVNLLVGLGCIHTPSVTITGVPNWFPTDTSVGIDTPGDGCRLYYPTKAAPTDTVELPPQWLPVEPKRENNQTIFKSPGGKLSVYGSSVADKLIPIHIGLLSTTIRQRLYIFLNNIVFGALYTFQYEDEAGNLYTVRWLDKTYDPSMEHWLKHVLNLTFRKEE